MAASTASDGLQNTGSVRLEVRHWVAFSLIAVIVVGGGIALTVWTQRRRARRRRLRGIKDHESQGRPRPTLS